jgi:hypothetical protein
MSHPCFDEKTRTDCPRRHCGCAVDCPDWAAYQKEREESYKKRARELEADRAIIDGNVKRATANQKRWMAYRANKTRRK